MTEHEQSILAAAAKLQAAALRKYEIQQDLAAAEQRLAAIQTAHQEALDHVRMARDELLGLTAHVCGRCGSAMGRHGCIVDGYKQFRCTPCAITDRWLSPDYKD